MYAKINRPKTKALRDGDHIRMVEVPQVASEIISPFVVVEEDLFPLGYRSLSIFYRFTTQLYQKGGENYFYLWIEPLRSFLSHGEGTVSVYLARAAQFLLSHGGGLFPAWVSSASRWLEADANLALKTLVAHAQILETHRQRVRTMTLEFHLIDQVSARSALNWRYETPYDVYNSDPKDIEEGVEFILDPQNNYYSITDGDGDLIAFCCFGSDARVAGGDYRLNALDIGLGVRPDLTGKRNGSIYVNAVIDFARGKFSPDLFRVTIAQFNKRALRVWEKAHFRPVEVFQRNLDNMSFVVLVREEST